MLNERQVKSIESKLNLCADVYYDTCNETVKESNRGWCQGIDFMLSMLGYRIVWDDRKATVVKDD